MGDHDTWYTILMPEFWARLEHGAQEHLGREQHFMMFQSSYFTLTHVAGAVLVILFLLLATFFYRRSLQDQTQGVVPSRRFGLSAMVDGFVGAVYKLSVDVMGEKNAKRFLPFTGTLALFIFASNLLGLVPGFLPPTDTLKTNFALAFLVFIVYNIYGIKENGLGYLAHFLGPKIFGFPILFWLFLPIEIISHVARPVSLSMRLTGNILADHKVVGIIALMVPLFVPVPFLLLGTVVAIVQTLVFTLLTIIYIGLAVEHEEH